MHSHLWKTLAASLLLVAACLPLGGGCSDDKDPAVKIYPPTEEGVAECKTDHPDQAAQCEQALHGARAEHETTVQHFSQADCFAQYGEAACLPRDNGSYFAPAMAGFMFGIGVNGVMPVYHPVYVNLSGQAYYGHTVIGTYRPGVHVYVTPAPNSVWVHQYRQTTFVNIPRSTPVAAPAFRPNPNGGAPQIERGKVGGAAAVSTAAPPRPPAQSATTPGAAPPHIERGNLGGAAAVSGAAPPRQSAAPPSAAAPAHQSAAPPSAAAPRIERGNAGGAAATTRTASPPSSPPPSRSAPSPSHSSSSSSSGKGR